MEKWQQILKTSVRSLKEIEDRFHIQTDSMKEADRAFPFRTTPYYWSLVEEPGDPIWKQIVPSCEELKHNEDLLDDPLGEEAHAPIPGIVHKYPDHCLFLVSNCCSSNCRFCTRKRKFRNPLVLDKSMIDSGIKYVRQHKEVRDVLLSGGDPFLLNDDKIEYILKGLREIPHLDIIRIGTRTPCVLPDRITPALAAMLKKYHPLYINVHFNHPRELTPHSIEALGRLADAGIPLGSQTVLLKGVNDDPETMRSLMRKLLAARVRPYYLLQCDLVYGTHHFRTKVEKGLEIMDQLRGWCSGLAVPQFIIDLPGGGTKVSLMPEYFKGKEGNTLIFRNFRGERCTYPELEDH